MGILGPLLTLICVSLAAVAAAAAFVSHARPGAALGLAAHAAGLAGLEPCAIDIHIGSQITDLGPFRTAFEKTADLLTRLRAKDLTITRLDLGGGLGVPYQRNEETPPDPLAYARLIAENFANSGCQIILEPGRLIAASAGILVTRVIRTKQGRVKNFMIVDAAMTELVRPTLYGAHHDIGLVRHRDEKLLAWDVVGPVCESGDFLGLARELPELDPGALLAVFSAGAYGAVLGSSYNTRPAAPEVLVDGATHDVVRRRPSYADMLAGEKIPDWLNSKDGQ